MRIEKITVDALQKSTDRDLHGFRLRFLQIWKKHFETVGNLSFGELNRGDFLDRYDILVVEMKKRDLRFTRDTIDSFLLRKRVMCNLDPALIGEIVLDENFISVSGLFTRDPKGADIIDIVLKKSEVDKDEQQELFLSEVIKKQIGKPIRFIYQENGPEKSHIPLFDLVLRPIVTLEKLPGIKKVVEDEKIDVGKNDVPYLNIMKVQPKEQIVGGVVYEPTVVDSQGDYTDEEEIRKAMYYFMEHGQGIRFMHGNDTVRAQVIESYQAPAKFKIGDQEIKKGTWWLSVKINDKKIWALVEKGDITGFSMGGSAQEA